MPGLNVSNGNNETNATSDQTAAQAILLLNQGSQQRTDKATPNHNSTRKAVPTISPQDNSDDSDTEEEITFNDHVGERVTKKFNDGYYYYGTVESYDRATRFWKIKFDDDDEEEWELGDLKKGLKIYDDGRREWNRGANEESRIHDEETDGGGMMQTMTVNNQLEAEVANEKPDDSEGTKYKGGPNNFVRGVHRCCLHDDYHVEYDSQFRTVDRIVDKECSGQKEGCKKMLKPGAHEPVYVCKKYWMRESSDSWGRHHCVRPHLCNSCYDKLMDEEEGGADGNGGNGKKTGGRKRKRRGGSTARK